MFEAATENFRKVMHEANIAAQRFNHEYIGTEHVLLGLLKVNPCTALQILRNLDVDPAKVKLEVEKLLKSGPDLVSLGKLPMTPRAKKVVTFAIEEANVMRAVNVGTEHLLLGLLREAEGVAGTVLMTVGLKVEEVRQEVKNLLAQKQLPLIQIFLNQEVKVPKIETMTFAERGTVAIDFSAAVPGCVISMQPLILAWILASSGTGEFDLQKFLGQLPEILRHLGPERTPGFLADVLNKFK
jgi:ATP-dependent Clp protease ATP-binding subunit ClpA